MIEVTNKIDCCGCTACASACPQKCIKMEQDNEGFLYPVVNKEICCDCHLCEHTCPVLGKEKTIAISLDKHEINKNAITSAINLPKSFVCFNNDTEIRQNSTSGGFFSILADYVLKKNGIVCGVILDDFQRVVHSFAENEVQLVKMRRSKYVQSDQQGVFELIKKELQKDRFVLYSGTPCQVAGLQKYLGKKYDKLITVDIFCHGVGSPAYWEKYINYIQEEAGSTIKEVRFREKTYGYNSACLAVYFENGNSKHKGHDDDMYWSPFSKNMIYRPSCYKCAFKNVNHVSDFSIGDFWSSKGLPELYSQANGCSLVLCHSDRAVNIFKEVFNAVTSYEVNLLEALDINGGHQASMLISCPSIPKDRDNWFRDMGDKSVPDLIKKYLPMSLKQKIKCCIKPMLYKIGLLELLKK